ncbi:TAT-binding protein-like protein 7, AAA ATPase [Malassezia caprae]|uniref:TAT-binding protein-like protein 7, AAA ATPase n=1 Tax=Malassezia caprae TaxID=1381934 RepID=A0AAF0E9D8_9BASI|nr:TAT-binding protein-like protein 7, AAA ATPase [Malassezia caprae]
MSPLRRSARHTSEPASPARERSQRKAARGAFYTQYFEEGELGEEEDTYEAPQDATDDEDQMSVQPRRVHVTRSGRRTTSYGTQPWDDEPTDKVVRPRRSTRVSKSLRDFVASDDEEEDENADYEETMRARRVVERAERAQRRQNLMDLAASRSARRGANGGDESSDAHARASSEESEDESAPAARHRSYSFRARKKINYALVPPPPEPLRDGFGRRIRRTSRHSTRAISDEPEASRAFSMSGLPRAGVWPSMPLSVPGQDLIGDMDSSDDEPPRTGLAPTQGALGGRLAAPLLENGPTPASGAGALGSATDAFGRVHEKDALADVDPLGVRMDIDFSQVGGLEDHVQQLKEMVSLPLLYPEVFQRFGVTPPRGVLFHGPPGTGKTLVARALAASCSTEGQKISFFMRKGADCLSKWVGEAERQLRLLFEEAKRAQPSIIFFDEIDGLAPVRSSKQDQIHASIVSTLLALMDGMDGRGQVVVIGATNRPDSVDPALRRPGRFDREFFFPLPSRAARRSILQIHTRHWDPPLDDSLMDVLVDATHGFGGADLRALCTEATLNAIQRRYPQIYRTTERLLLAPETIHVDGRDFLLALDHMVPSSARSASASSTPLAPHLRPLLASPLQECEALFARLLPQRAKRKALEEAIYEDDVATAVPEDRSGAARLERELLQQSFVQAQVHRPRLLLHGMPGLGQRTMAEALLHSIEGFHVLTISAAQLLGDGTQTPEAILSQQFQEARRLMPSVMYVPDVDRWPTLYSEHLHEMMGALLHGLHAQDRIMLLATSETPAHLLPTSIRAWFGHWPWHLYALQCPSEAQRREFWHDVAVQAARPPTQFADAVPRRLRLLEDLPKAPPRPPRMPTQVELHQQVEHDARLLEHLKFHLGSVLAELRKKFKKFTRDVWDEYNLRTLMEQFEWRREKGKVIIQLRYDRHPAADSEAESGRSASPDVEEPEPDKAMDVGEAGDVPPAMDEAIPSAEALHGAPYDVDAEAAEEPRPAAGGQDDADPENSAYILRDFTIYTMTLDKMQKRLYHNQYLTCDAFMEDLGKIVSNAEAASEVDSDRVFRAHQMQNFARILLDQYIDAPFRTECATMATRVLAREEDARRETERKKELEVHSRRPNGQRYSARMLGEEPQPCHLVDVSTIERAHKRQRSHGPEEDTTHSPSITQASASESPAPDGVIVPVMDSAAPPAPSLNTPSVLLDEAAQAQLVEALVQRTSDFTLEQLEQTRAGCYERILAHRSSWQRDALLRDLYDLAQKMRDAVRAESTETL